MLYLYGGFVCVPEEALECTTKTYAYSDKLFTFSTHDKRWTAIDVVGQFRPAMRPFASPDFRNTTGVQDPTVEIAHGFAANGTDLYLLGPDAVYKFQPATRRWSNVSQPPGVAIERERVGDSFGSIKYGAGGVLLMHGGNMFVLSLAAPFDQSPCLVTEDGEDFELQEPAECTLTLYQYQPGAPAETLWTAMNVSFERVFAVANVGADGGSGTGEGSALAGCGCSEDSDSLDMSGFTAPFYREFFGHAFSDGKLYVQGGTDAGAMENSLNESRGSASSPMYNDLWELDITSFTWKMLAESAKPRKSVSDVPAVPQTHVPVRLVAVDNKLYGIGAGDDPRAMFKLKQKKLGLKWHRVGSEKPQQGREITNAKLRKALKTKSEFAREEWIGFGIHDLRDDDFIRVGKNYFRPSEVSGGGNAAHPTSTPSSSSSVVDGDVGKV